jgi:hypothetical protein
MGFLVDLFEFIDGDPGVNLGALKTFMTQHLLDVPDIGTIRSFLPLPWRTIKVPPSKSMSLIFKLANSCRRIPVEKKVSNIARSRTP